MKNRRRHAAAVLTACLAASMLADPADADLVMGEPVAVPIDASQIIIEFAGSDAGYSGDFYFLGWGGPDELLELAPDTAKPGLGMKLFNNHAASAGDTITIDGVFSAGAVLHFAYDVVSGRPDTFRTDVAADRSQFAWDAAAGRLGIEDILLGDSDGDYNDAMLNITFTPVDIPAPGSVALLVCAGAIPLRSRRRRDE